MYVSQKRVTARVQNGIKYENYRNREENSMKKMTGKSKMMHSRKLVEK